MPPAPSVPTTSNDPRRVPGLRAMKWRVLAGTLPPFDDGDIGHRVVLQVLRVDFPACGRHGARQDRVIDVDAVRGMPAPVELVAMVDDGLRDRFGLEAREERTRGRFLIGFHE